MKAAKELCSRDRGLPRNTLTYFGIHGKTRQYIGIQRNIQKYMEILRIIWTCINALDYMGISFKNAWESKVMLGLRFNWQGCILK